VSFNPKFKEGGPLVAELGGYEYYGIRRCLPFPEVFSEIRNGKIEQLAINWIEIP